MPVIKLKETESFDAGLRRFKRSCDKAGIIAEVRKREFYEKPTSVRKRKAAAAVKRASTNSNFSVSLIPETIERTNLSEIKKGDYLNIEADQQTITIVETVKKIKN